MSLWLIEDIMVPLGCTSRTIPGVIPSPSLRGFVTMAYWAVRRRLRGREIKKEKVGCMRQFFPDFYAYH